jgi:hypothetical protein
MTLTMHITRLREALELDAMRALAGIPAAIKTTR